MCDLGVNNNNHDKFFIINDISCLYHIYIVKHDIIIMYSISVQYRIISMKSQYHPALQFRHPISTKTVLAINVHTIACNCKCTWFCVLLRVMHPLWEQSSYILCINTGLLTLLLELTCTFTSVGRLAFFMGEGGRDDVLFLPFTP